MKSSTDWLTWQLVDSAFPTGGFAHSWGLEAAWQHGEVATPAALGAFVRASVLQAGFGVLPLVNVGYDDPARLEELDAIDDAFLTNAVANRASRAQGRTLIATANRVWPAPEMAALAARTGRTAAHFAPVAGVVFRTAGLPRDTAQRVVVFLAVRGVLAAAVRLGIVGSYEAQRMQAEAGPDLEAVIRRSAGFDERDLGQTAPVLEVLQGAHDRLYSRLFQS